MSRRNRAWIGSTVVWLSVTGCRHKVSVALVPDVAVPSISVPPPTHKSEPFPFMEVEILPALTLQVPRQPLPHFRPRPTTARQLALLLPAQHAPVALGVLSTGGESTDLELRQQTEALLHGQQQRLQTLPRASVSLHAQQVEQARLFLQQALDAWRDSDLEGARVLANKAKLLLDEI